MKISEIISQNVTYVSPHTTVMETAQTMKILDAGMLPVCDHNRLVGTVTDRDITIRRAGKGCDARHTPIADVDDSPRGQSIVSTIKTQTKPPGSCGSTRSAGCRCLTVKGGWSAPSPSATWLLAMETKKWPVRCSAASPLDHWPDDTTPAWSKQKPNRNPSCYDDSKRSSSKTRRRFCQLENPHHASGRTQCDASQK